MEKISLEKEETETFNWDIPSGLTVNRKIETPGHTKIYSHEGYASALYALYRGANPARFSSSAKNPPELELPYMPVSGDL